MAHDLADLGRTVDLRPARRGRSPLLVVVLGLLLVAGAVAARLADDADPSIDELVAPPPAEELAPLDDAGEVAPPDDAAEADTAVDVPAPMTPVLGTVGDLTLHVPALDPLLVSYHEASFIEALTVRPLGSLSRNDNPTRPLAHEDHPDGVPFHVQVSRGRANASTSAVDVVLLPGEAVRAPVDGVVTDVRPYQLYGRYDDVRLELAVEGQDLAVVLIHVEDVVVQAGDRVRVGDVLAGGARAFPFGAVVDRLTEPDRYGHVHMEIKAPE